MNDKYALLKRDPKPCQRLFGVKPAIIEDIIGKVQKHFEQKLQENPISKRGLNPGISIENQVLLTLEYLRQYPTFLVLGASYGISESYANKIYHKTRPVLAEIFGLKNPERIRFKHVQNAIIDVAAQPIERPEKDQEKHYNRHKKNISLNHK